MSYPRTMSNQHDARWQLPLLVVLLMVFTRDTPAVRGSDKPRDSATPAKRLTDAEAIALVKQLGGYVHVVDGQVQGLLFVTEEIFVVGAPNQVTEPTVTDQTLAVIKSFPHLKSLAMDDKKITDQGMVHLAELQELEELALAGTLVTERGLKHLAHCKHLKKLDLRGFKISEKGMQPLTANMALAHTLRELNLSGGAIDDGGAAVLGSFSSLRILGLSNTNVGDEAIEHLSKLKELKLVHLNSTRVTPAGAAALRRALPKAKIITEDPAP